MDCCSCEKKLLLERPAGFENICDSCANIVECTQCGEYHASDNMASDPDGDPLCFDCYDESYVECGLCGKIICTSDIYKAPDLDIYCHSCWERNCTECSSCHRTIWENDAYCTPDDNLVCEPCFSDVCVCCESCDSTIWIDEANYNADSVPFCNECYGQDDFTSLTFQPDGVCKQMPSPRCFGVEIETHTCDGYMDLDGLVYFDSKYDASVSGKEFASTILQGDKGLEAIKTICQFAKNNSWSVSGSCGLHIHLDMDGLNDTSLQAIAASYLMTEDIWQQLVDQRRLDNIYCRPISWRLAELSTPFRHFSFLQNRYNWFNVAAYNVHNTFEIRLHEGTLDSEAICNWVKIHSIFVDWAEHQTKSTVEKTFSSLTDEEKFDFIMDLCKDADCFEVVDFYRERAALVNN